MFFDFSVRTVQLVSSFLTAHRHMKGNWRPQKCFKKAFRRELDPS